MVQIGFLEFLGYREWTESLGHDREWYIQATQAKLYQINQLFTSQYEGLVLPLRYDMQLMILPPEIDRERYIKGLIEALKPYTPTEVSIELMCGPIPEVLERRNHVREKCGGKVAVFHADLNYFTKRTKEVGPYLTYLEILDVVHEYAMSLKEAAIVQYLGGDNLAVIAEKEKLDSVINELVKRKGIKIGIGISHSPRKAFALAAKSLGVIRKEGRVRTYLIEEDS